LDASVSVEVVVALGSELGEGPIWDERTGRLVWVDILGRRVHATDPDTGETSSIETPLDVGAVAARPAGGFVAALEDGFWILGDGPARRITAVPESRPGLRFNDGKCDPAGRFWAGTMAYDVTPGAGALYRLDTDGRATLILPGVTLSNGLAWSGDGRTMFYVDSPTQRIDAFTFDPATGSVADRRTVVEIPAADGTPDGLTIDEDDGLWVALAHDGTVRRFVGGREDRVIQLPVSLVTSVTFGGPDRDILFITSAWEHMTDEERAREPLAGAVFRARPGVRGRPADVYRGV
jgi:sugar lactone lactonase YvrE